MKYDAFGKITWLDEDFDTKNESDYAWNRTFTGQVYDAETGLMLYRNRFYHTGLGRFVTKDPIGYASEDVNLYRYCSNNSIQYFDSMGKQKELPGIDPGAGGKLSVRGCKSPRQQCIDDAHTNAVRCLAGCGASGGIIEVVVCIAGCTLAGPYYLACVATCSGATSIYAIWCMRGCYNARDRAIAACPP